MLRLVRVAAAVSVTVLGACVRPRHDAGPPPAGRVARLELERLGRNHRRGSDRVPRRALHGDSGKTGRFIGLLGRLGGRYVMDLQPDVTQLRVVQAYVGLLQPMLGFLVLDSIGEPLRFSTLDPDSMKRYLVAHPNELRADTLTSGVVLEAAPQDLQAFLVGYLRRPGVLSEPATWVRRSR